MMLFCFLVRFDRSSTFTPPPLFPSPPFPPPAIPDKLTSDFVLVSCDVVANVDLRAAVAAHRARREADRSAIATLLVATGQTPAQRARLGEPAKLYVTDPASGRLLAVHDARATGAGAAAPLALDAGLFGERSAVSVRGDLSGVHAAVLAPEAAMLFSDNFDYQSFSRDFVAGTLAEEELGNKLYLHECDG
jgi:translation initiation factor eIF-2B subunit epsilon